MKLAVKVTGGLMVPVALAIVFFFFEVAPARAPAGGKLWTGGRAIASLQEADFDRRLLKLQLCYGVRVVAEQCTLERRRVCKAMVLHEVESAFEPAGKFLRAPLSFICEDTAFSQTMPDEDASVSLRPNEEERKIQGALDAGLAQATLSLTQHRRAREACEFVTDCKWAMRPTTLSLRKLAACITTNDASHRTLLLDEWAAMLFGGKNGRRATLYPRFVDEARNEGIFGYSGSGH